MEQQDPSDFHRIASEDLRPDSERTPERSALYRRSVSGLEISDTPCNTTKGLVRTVDDPRKLLGRYARLSNKWTLIETLEEAATYKGKKVEMRSTMECRAEGFTVCADCMGSSFRGMKNAMNNIAAGFSGESMSLFLKRMHTSGFKLPVMYLGEDVNHSALTFKEAKEAKESEADATIATKAYVDARTNANQIS